MSKVTSPKTSSTPGASESLSLLQSNLANSNDSDMRLKKCWRDDRRIQVDVLAGLFGISAWLCVNAMFTQLPLLVQSAPEGWSLPSFLSILIQLANVGPILYSLSQSYCPGRVSDCKLIYLVLLLGSASLILMARFYDVTSTVFGKPHSVVLFVLAFCIAIVGCTSSVLFIPFMNNYPEVYLISYMVGEGLSGFLPSIISLVQGVGGAPSCINSTTPTGEVIVVPHSSPPLFSTGVFFFIIFAIMSVSTVSFFLLNNIPTCRAQKLKKPSATRPSVDSPDLGIHQEPEPFVRTNDSSALPGSIYRLLLLITIGVSMLANGALPSVQSYSCLPYGNVAYHLAVNLGNMANPAACFLAFFMPQISPAGIFSLLAVSGVGISYVLTAAFLSPSPPLQSSTLGVCLIVGSWVLSCGLMSYIKMSIAALYRRHGGRGLFWYGAMTQVGAFFGSSLMFYLVNYTHLFSSYDPCR